MPIKSCLRQEHESKSEGHTLFYGKESLVWNEICNSRLTFNYESFSLQIPFQQSRIGHNKSKKSISYRSVLIPVEIFVIFITSSD